MTRAELTPWIDAYERAWRSPGTESLEELFATDASYRAAPFEEPLRGLAAISAFWEAGREGPDEGFTLAAEPVAVEGEVGVAREVRRYGDPVTSHTVTYGW